nr:hypothetical protein CFP56_22343 [Quercus suber]
MSERNRGNSQKPGGSGLDEGSIIGRTKTSGPYDRQFEQILVDNGIYPEYSSVDDRQAPEPENLEEIRERLQRRRSSLSSFSEGEFRDFRKVNRCTESEQDAKKNVIPTITGREGDHIGSSEHEFTALVLFDSSLQAPKPDIYYGARPDQIDPRVRADLGPYILPTSFTEHPAAPNHFFEIEGPSDGWGVLPRRAIYNGAVGARGMFRLQNYGRETPSYDNNAYAIVSAYHPASGALQIFATHPRQSVTTGGTEYHMMQLGAYVMTGNLDAFRQGAAAYRNARDMSREYRDQFIAEANATARNLPAVASPSNASPSN